MEHHSAEGEFREHVTAALGPALAGVARAVEIFMEDHPEIANVDQLTDAFCQRMNDAGNVQFETGNPRRERIIGHEPEFEAMTIIVAGEIMDEVSRKLRTWAEAGSGTLAA